MLKDMVGGQFFNLGYSEEISYWKSLGGTGSTCLDCMVSYLGSQGYKGNPRDSLRAWLQATKGKSHGRDNARALVGYK